MEAIFLGCGAGGPQLKRNPLDGAGAFLPSLLLFALILTVASASILGLLAMANLSDYGKQRRDRIWFLSLLLLGRQYFTPVGWRFRNAALLSILIWPLALFLFMVRGSSP